MTESNRQKAIQEIETIVSGFKLKHPISQKKLTMLYGFLEENFDEELQEIEDTILLESENANKAKKIQLLVNLFTNDQVV